MEAVASLPGPAAGEDSEGPLGSHGGSFVRHPEGGRQLRQQESFKRLKGSVLGLGLESGSPRNTSRMRWGSTLRPDPGEAPIEDALLALTTPRSNSGVSPRPSIFARRIGGDDEGDLAAAAAWLQSGAGHPPDLMATLASKGGGDLEALFRVIGDAVGSIVQQVAQQCFEVRNIFIVVHPRSHPGSRNTSYTS